MTYLLAVPLADSNDGQRRGGPLRIRTPASSSLVGAATAELAAHLKAAAHLPAEVEILPLAEAMEMLAALSFDEKAVLIFSTREEIDSYVAAPSDYVARAHSVPVSALIATDRDEGTIVSLAPFTLPPRAHGAVLGLLAVTLGAGLGYLLFNPLVALPADAVVAALKPALQSASAGFKSQEARRPETCSGSSRSCTY